MRNHDKLGRLGSGHTDLVAVDAPRCFKFLNFRRRDEQLVLVADEQMARLRPYFPKSHGKPRVDDKRVLSGIIFVNRNGLR